MLDRWGARRYLSVQVVYRVCSRRARMQQRVQELVTTRPETSARALILLGAFVSFVLSVSLWFGGNEQQGIFVGLWVPSILSLGALVAPRSER
jgi:hypothetical protein